jgi:3-oxoacyl-[acyl-carrier protein] reductase
MQEEARPYLGKVVAVTGAAAGFGAAFSRAFAEAGAAVALLDVDAAGAQALADEIVGCGGRAVALPCDVADERAVEAAAARAADHLGGADVLINNAGLHLTRYNQPFAQLGHEEIRRLFEVNLMGVINCTLAFKPLMAARGGGAIVNISSIAGYLASTPYGVSKLAVRGLTIAFARELSEARIRVNAIAPGLIATPSAVADLPSEMVSAFVNQHQQVKRQGEMGDIVSAALFLCSPQASFITGETIKISGGYPLGV